MARSPEGRCARDAALPSRARQSSIAPDVGTRRLQATTRRASLDGAVDALPAGRARRAARARAGRCASSSASTRPAPDIHLGHCVVLDEAARVPGRRPHGRPDHRRLHGPGRRPQRARRRRGRCSRGEEIDANAAHLPGAGLQGARPRAHRGAPQQRVAGHAERRAVRAGPRGSRSRGCSSATTSPSGWRRERADLGPRAALPGAPGLRLGRGRAPTSSSAAPTRSSTCCSAATSSSAYGSAAAVDPDDADPARAPTASRKMCKSLGNYVGVTEPPEEMFGKLMSIPDEAMAELLRAAARRGRSIRRATRGEAKRELARPARRPLPRRRGRRPRRRRASTASTCAASCPRTIEEAELEPARDGTSTCRRCSPSVRRSAAARRAGCSTRAACRLDGEPRRRRTPRPARPPSSTARCCRSASAASRGCGRCG